MEPDRPPKIRAVSEECRPRLTEVSASSAVAALAEDASERDDTDAVSDIMSNCVSDMASCRSTSMSFYSRWIRCVHDTNAKRTTSDCSAVSELPVLLSTLLRLASLSTPSGSPNLSFHFPFDPLGRVAFAFTA